MRRITIVALFLAFLGTVATTQPAEAESGKFYEVTGVESGDMLKLRRGPGTGFEVIVGLPNGTVLRLHDCDQIGSTAWCKVSLKEARNLKGYVSWNYLKKL